MPAQTPDRSPARFAPASSTTIASDAQATSSFARLGADAHSQRALARMNIETPTLIQTRALPPLLAGRDVIGQSRTGSGKTIAFGLPLVQRLDPRQRQLQALVLVPTRELASQVADVLMALGGGRGLRVAQLIGGRSIGPQREALRMGAQIAVGAPGRVLDHLRQRSLDLSALSYAVLDEADQMLDAGFAPDVERILSAMPTDRQLAFFTATLPEWTTKIAQRFLREPVHVNAGEPESRPASAITQIVYTVPQEQRLGALIALLNRRRDATGTTLVFGRTKHGVMKLARQLTARGYPVAALQGNMSQNARDRVMADFRAGRAPVLLATNVAARGLDVLSIEQVINYELPESAELFTHRVGRTGRMDRAGEAITLLSQDDLPAWKKLQRTMAVKLQPRPWPHHEMPLGEAPAPASAAPAESAPVAMPQPTPFARADLERPQRPARAPQSSHAPARPDVSQAERPQHATSTANRARRRPYRPIRRNERGA